MAGRWTQLNLEIRLLRVTEEEDCWTDFKFLKRKECLPVGKNKYSYQYVFKAGQILGSVQDQYGCGSQLHRGNA